MHILFVSGEYPPQTGGVGAYTAALGRALAALGLQVTVLTSDTECDPSGSDHAGVTVLRTMPDWRWRARGRVAACAREAAADWIHLQYQTAAFTMHPAVNLAVNHWRGQGRQVAWTYHDLLVPYLFPKAGKRLRNWVTLRPARQADLVVATNAVDYTHLQPIATGLPANIPIGSNIEGVHLDETARRVLRQQHGYGDDDLIVGYFGFFNRSKGGLSLVRTLHQLVAQGLPARLHMVGERVGASDVTNFAYLAEVEALAAELSLAERIRWTGRLDEAEVGAELNICDVLLLPYEDGVSLRRGTLMAALANGCPIVTTAPPAPIAPLQDGVNMQFVAAGDHQQMADAVRHLFEDKALAQLLASNARRTGAEFRWERIAQLHLDAYTQVQS